MLLFLHFRPRSVIPVSAYSLFDNGYDLDTSQEFTYTLSSQNSTTQSPLNPYMSLPQTMRLQQDTKYEWSVAMTQIYYNPTGTIPMTIQGVGTFMSGAVSSDFTIQLDVTLEMLCDISAKFVPYLIQRFNDEMTAQRHPTCPPARPYRVLRCVCIAIVGIFSTNNFVIDYAKSNIDEKLLTRYLGFDATRRAAETTVTPGRATQRAATNRWSPQLFACLYVRAPTLVFTDEFLVYNGNCPETTVPNTIYRLMLDSDAVVDPNGVNIVVDTPRWISIGFESHTWFETNLVVALADAASIYDSEVQALLQGATYVTLTFRMQLKRFVDGCDDDDD